MSYQCGILLLNIYNMNNILVLCVACQLKTHSILIWHSETYTWKCSIVVIEIELVQHLVMCGNYCKMCGNFPDRVLITKKSVSC